MPQSSDLSLTPQQIEEQALRDNAHRWEVFLKDQPRGRRPEVSAVVRQHYPFCKSRKNQNPNCLCPKYGQPRGGGRDSRFPLFAKTWAMANQRVEEYMDARDAEKVREAQRNAEWDEKHGHVPKLISEGLAEIYKYAESQTRKPRQNEKTQNGKLDKHERQDKHFLEFLNKHNAEQKAAALKAGQPEPAPIEYFHQLTFQLLQFGWKPTWPVKTPRTINAYRAWFAAKMHYAQEQHWMKDLRSLDQDDNCSCIAHKIGGLEISGKDNPKMPFNDMPTPEAHGGDREWQMKLLYKACPKLSTKQRPNLGIQMENFIRVGRYSGARIVDVSLMQVNAIDDLGVWTFQPLKTKYKSGAWVSVQLPPRVVRALREMPRVHRDFFFWDNVGAEQAAQRSWTEDLFELWPLVDKAAGLEAFVDEQGLNRWGIRDAFSNELVAVSFHTFRNTFAVSGRIEGMSYARIAECLGNTEKIVKKHYSRYTRGLVNAISEDVRGTWSEEDRAEWATMAATYRQRMAAVKQFEATSVAPSGALA